MFGRGSYDLPVATDRGEKTDPASLVGNRVLFWFLECAVGALAYTQNKGFLKK